MQLCDTRVPRLVSSFESRTRGNLLTCSPFSQPQPKRGSQGGQPWGPRLTLSLFFFLLCPRVKAKKGVTLLGTKSRSGQWHVTSELLAGAKHSTATVDVSRAQGTPLPPW